MSLFGYEIDEDGVATILIDMPGSVNVMNAEFTDTMDTVVKQLAEDANVIGVVIASGKDTFFAGGDVKGMAAAPGEGYNELITEGIARGRLMIRGLEQLKVPVVAAINGAALGGGYELTLACNHRIAWDDKSVVIGLPEVTLGLMPGGGGVVRLTKKFGFQKACPFLLEGKILPAEKALEAGLVDELTPTRDGLLSRGKAWVLENKDNSEAAIQPWDVPGYKIPGGDLSHPGMSGMLHFAAFSLFKDTRGLLPNKQLILDTMVETLKLDIDTALKIEGRGLVSLIISPVSKNMMSANFFQINQIKRGASRPSGIERSKVKKIGVISADMEGQNIATISAMAGVEVVLHDASLARAKKDLTHVNDLLGSAAERAEIDADQVASVQQLITLTENASDLTGCDLIIDAGGGDVDSKVETTKAFEGQLNEDGVWVTRTSMLPTSLLAAASADPSRFIGFNILPTAGQTTVIEIVCGEETSDVTSAKAFDFVRQIRKTPIVVKDKPGFFSARTMGSQLWEAAEMVGEGVHPVRLDNLARAFGMSAGPLTMHDAMSQRLSVEEKETQLKLGLITDQDDPRPRGTALVADMVEQGRGGRAYDGGYFDYAGNEKMIWPGLLERYYKSDLDISDQDIKDRLLFASVIESLKCLEEGVLRTVADGNIGSLRGIGAPIWTGGYIQFVNTYGLEAFVERCGELASRYGERFNAPAIVAEKLATGETFA